MKHEVHPDVRAYVDDRKLVKLSDTKGREKSMDEARKQLQDAPIFSSPAPIPAESAEEVLRRVLEGAGCSHARDAVDERVVKSVREKEFLAVVRSQNDVGGWPVLVE